MGVGVWLPVSPFAGVLGFTPLPRAYWGWLACFLLTYAVLTHAVKVWFHHRFGVD